MAFYLYCLRKKNPIPIKAVKTVNKGEAYPISHHELEAVVSEVNLKEFGSEEIQKKAQEDVNWIKEKAQIHEHVIERAMGLRGKIVPVIPMKFGTIFKTKQSLEEILEKNYLKFKKLLADLEGKQEWGVKVYLNEKVFTKHLQAKKKKKEIASLPKGMDFFVKKQMEEVMKKEKNRKLEKLVGETFENLQKLAVDSSQGKNLDKALTGKEEPMVLNASFLVKEEKVREFQNQVRGLKAEYQRLGLIIQESGPWPPYNFAKI